MVVTEDPEIQRVITSLHDSWHVEYMAPGHCTGEPTFTALKKIFGDHYLYAGLGTTLTLGPAPSSQARQADSRDMTVALDDEDLKSYRTLLAKESAHDTILLVTRNE